MFEFDTSEDVGGGDGNFLTEPGTYHCSITGVAEGEGPSGKPIDGVTIRLSVLAGTVEGQQDKEFNLCLFAPDLSASEKSQEWAKRKLTALAVATGLLSPDKLGQRFSADIRKAEGRQIILTLEEDNRDQERKYLQLSFANIYHVDDPRAAKFPKNSEALKLIPKELRKSAEYFEPLRGGRSNGRRQSLSQEELAEL